jgi:hypothetical protein
MRRFWRVSHPCGGGFAPAIGRGGVACRLWLTRGFRDITVEIRGRGTKVEAGMKEVARGGEGEGVKIICEIQRRKEVKEGVKVLVGSGIRERVGGEDGKDLDRADGR